MEEESKKLRYDAETGKWENLPEGYEIQNNKNYKIGDKTVAVLHTHQPYWSVFDTILLVADDKGAHYSVTPIPRNFDFSRVDSMDYDYMAAIANQKARYELSMTNPEIVPRYEKNIFGFGFQPVFDDLEKAKEYGKRTRDVMVGCPAELLGMSFSNDHNPHYTYSRHDYIKLNEFKIHNGIPVSDKSIYRVPVLLTHEADMFAVVDTLKDKGYDIKGDGIKKVWYIDFDSEEGAKDFSRVLHTAMAANAILPKPYGDILELFKVPSLAVDERIYARIDTIEKYSKMMFRYGDRAFDIDLAGKGVSTLYLISKGLPATEIKSMRYDNGKMTFFGSDGNIYRTEHLSTESLSALIKTEKDILESEERSRPPKEDKQTVMNGNDRITIITETTKTKNNMEENHPEGSLHEKVAFESKEDLKAYIMDYCVNHGWDSDLNHIDVSKITDMSGLFFGIPFSGDISKWDVSNVTNMSGMFQSCPFNGDISKWNTGNVTDMSNMFFMSQFNQSINDWNTANVKNMSTMFMHSPFNQPIDKWNTANVETMAGMFMDTPFNRPIGSWNTSTVKYMNHMFQQSVFNQDISSWNTSNVGDMSSMFSLSQFNQPLDKWEVSNVITMRSMFFGSDFNQPIGNWNVSKVTDMALMFKNSKFNQNLSDWNVSHVIDMHSMFAGSALSVFPDFRIKGGVIVSGMFEGTQFEKEGFERINKNSIQKKKPVSFDNKEDLQKYIKDYCEKHGWDSDLNHIDVSNMENLAGLFLGTPFTGDISKWDTSNVKDMSGMFSECPFNGDLSGWDTGNVTNMSYMFDKSPFNRDISRWDTSSVTTMKGMFSGSQFSQPINDWDTGNVKDMSHMFWGSRFNQSLDNWDVSGVVTMENMFAGSRFTQDISGWKTLNLENMSEMFLRSRFGEDLSSWDIQKVKDMTSAFAYSSQSHMPAWKVDCEHVSTHGIFDGTPLEGREREIRFPKPDPVKITDKTHLKSYIEKYCERNGWDSDLNHIDVSGINDMSGLFKGTKFTGDISKWDVSNVTDMRAMFKDSYFNGNLSEWNTKNVKNMSCMFDNSRFNGDITNWNLENVKHMNSMFLDSYFTGDVSKLNIPKMADTEDMFADSEYELQHPNWKNEIELQKSRTPIQKETIKQDTTMETTEGKKERQSIILSPEQLLDRALETASVGNGKWLNHKSIHSPQLYGYTSRNPENTLSGFQQVLLSLNSHENQYHTNIYVTRKGIKDNNLALNGEQKGVLIPSPDGRSKQYFNIEQLDLSTVRDGHANSLLAKSKHFKTLNMAETDDVTRNRDLLDRDPSSIVLFRKGERFYLYEESAMRLKDLTGIAIRETPETGVKYTSFNGEDIDRYIKAISDSGHRVVIANSAYSLKGFNIRSIENRAIREIQTLAVNEGFSTGKVTYMPSNYMPGSDTVSLNVTGKERSTIEMLREIGEIYHAGLEALYSESRLAGYQKLPMGQRQGHKFSRLVLEVATGVQMLRNGLPSVISEDNMPLIPFWQQELREDPKAIKLLETHVNALTEAYERSMKGHKLDYDLLLSSDKDIDRTSKPFRAESATISRTLGDYTNLQERKFVVMRDPKRSSAIIIFPTGASTVFDKETKGFNKENIHDSLGKESYTQVYFFTPDTFESLNKPNEFFKDYKITVEKLRYGNMETVGKIDVGQEIKRTSQPVVSVIVPFVNAVENRKELYLRTPSGEELTVPLSDDDIKRLAETVRQKDRAAANQTRMEVARKYYAAAKSDPSIVSDYLHPSIPAEKYAMIERSWVTRDENRDYFIGARISGKDYPLRQMSFADKSLFMHSDDKVSFKEAVVTRAFAAELGLTVKTDVCEGVDSAKAEDSGEREERENEQPRRSFRR